MVAQMVSNALMEYQHYVSSKSISLGHDIFLGDYVNSIYIYLKIDQCRFLIKQTQIRAGSA